MATSIDLIHSMENGIHMENTPILRGFAFSAPFKEGKFAFRVLYTVIKDDDSVEPSWHVVNEKQRNLLIYQYNRGKHNLIRQYDLSLEKCPMTEDEFKTSLNIPYERFNRIIEAEPSPQDRYYID